MRRLAPLLITLFSLLALAGCSDSDSPTAPLSPNRAINGTFVGPLPDRIPGEDWSTTTMELRTEGAVSGTITPNVGETRPVGGTWANTNLILSVGNLPQTGDCYQITMSIYRFERDSANQVSAFEGTLSGRCQGTLSGGFRMERR